MVNWSRCRAPPGRARSTLRGRCGSKKQRLRMAGSTPSRARCSAEPMQPRVRAGAAAACALLGVTLAAAAQSATLVPFTVVGDAIPASLTGMPGDAERGRAIVVNRQVGLCLLCHTGPFPEERFQGTLAPDLSGAGARATEGQLRLRIVDASRIEPDTIMPPYYRIDGLTRVAPAFQDKPILTAEQVEDVVAFLMTLRE